MSNEILIEKRKVVKNEHSRPFRTTRTRTCMIQIKTIKYTASNKTTNMG